MERGEREAKDALLKKQDEEEEEKEKEEGEGEHKQKMTETGAKVEEKVEEILDYLLDEAFRIRRW